MSWTIYWAYEYVDFVAFGEELSRREKILLAQ